MSNADALKRDPIQTELNDIEAQNGAGCDREQLHRREDDVRAAIEAVPNPVLKTEYSRRLSVLRGKR